MSEPDLTPIRSGLSIYQLRCASRDTVESLTAQFLVGSLSLAEFEARMERMLRYRDSHPFPRNPGLRCSS